ncbi:MAG: hypothetical protein U9O97_06410 [Elusimicrobiota bacterium]|nr:hypothetical protein [Elusimicrobiota bacterium]
MKLGYAGLTELYRNYALEDKERRYTEIAWRKTLKKFPQWPEQLSWSLIENRQYLRAICNKATFLHRKGAKAEAEKIYRLLLKLNPSDNLGARYLLAGLFRGLMPQDIDKMTEEGNRKQDWIKLDDLLYEEDEKYNFLGEDDEKELPGDEGFFGDFNGPLGNA